jgi:hypothetical protein
VTWLPAIFRSKAPAVIEPKNYEIQVKQTEALQTIGDSLKAISSFISQGGLSAILQSQSMASGANALLQGLTAHDGRKGLDARTLKQNSVEIAEQILLVHAKFKERLEAQAKGEVRDEDMHDAETDFAEWKKEQK